MSVWIVLRHYEGGLRILGVCSTLERAYAVAAYWRSPEGPAGHAIYHDAWVAEYVVDVTTEAWPWSGRC